MIFLPIGVCMIYTLIELTKKRHKITPMTIFSILWLIILILSGLRLYYLNAPNEQVYLIIFVGLVAWGVGYYLLSYITPAKPITTNYTIRKLLIYFLIVLSLLFCIKDLRNVFSTLKGSFNLAQIRALSQDSTSVLYNDNSNLETAIRSFVINPFAMAYQSIVACEFWKGRKKWLVLDIFIIVLRILTQGTRILFIYLIINFIIFYYLSASNGKVGEYFRKTFSKKRIVLIIFITIILLLIMTLSRSGNRALRSTYYYYAMEPYMMGEWMKSIKGWGYGTVSLNGLVYSVIYFLKNVIHIISEYPQTWYNDIFLLINNTDQTWITISNYDNTQANAYVSIFWFPYVDGGFLGEAVIMFLYGAIVQHYYKITHYFNNVGDLQKCVYALLVQWLLFSFVRFQFADIAYALSFIYIIILYKHSSTSYWYWIGEKLND